MKKFPEWIKSINYKYFVKELFIVVAGILIALTLNSWREDNTNSSKEQFYLKSLKRDFDKSLASLNEILEQNQTSRASLTKMIYYIHSGNQNVSSDSLTILFKHLFGFNRFIPASGTYNEIIFTGSLQILKDSDLRISLSSWDDMILRIRQLEEVMFWQYHLINIPYLNKHIYRADFAKDYLNLSGKGKPKTDFNKLFADPEFENILVNRLGSVDETDRYLDDMIKEVKNIIKQIDRDIAD